MKRPLRESNNNSSEPEAKNPRFYQSAATPSTSSESDPPQRSCNGLPQISAKRNYAPLILVFHDKHSQFGSEDRYAGSQVRILPKSPVGQNAEPIFEKKSLCQEGALMHLLLKIKQMIPSLSVDTFEIYNVDLSPNFLEAFRTTVEGLHVKNFGCSITSGADDALVSGLLQAFASVDRIHNRSRYGNSRNTDAIRNTGLYMRVTTNVLKACIQRGVSVFTQFEKEPFDGLGATNVAPCAIGLVTFLYENSDWEASRPLQLAFHVRQVESFLLSRLLKAFNARGHKHHGRLYFLLKSSTPTNLDESAVSMYRLPSSQCPRSFVCYSFVKDRIRMDVLVRTGTLNVVIIKHGLVEEFEDMSPRPFTSVDEPDRFSVNNEDDLKWLDLCCSEPNVPL
ncbi:hypothetical protein AAVH_36794 [Aphelenchoides avenae]|nr:hypothetical protein AAVH_36794 [Aphelenchus avenae]